MFILCDSRRSDKLRGLENDLDWQFIKNRISGGCEYCGDVVGKMTLDRIDNSIGHVRTNVVAACMRCNMFRRDMPFEAWLMLVPSLKEAREYGLLDGWNAGTVKGARGRKAVEQDLKIAVGI